MCLINMSNICEIGLSSYQKEFRTFSKRFETFQNWPKSETLKFKLVNAFFIYTEVDDVVICPFCHVEGFRWEEDDDPLLDHQYWSPQCPIFTVEPSEGEDVGPVLPVKIKEFDCDYMISIRSRYESFEHWPKSIPVSVDLLVESGFYYNKIGDRTSCFSCGLTVHNWEEGDDPWIEHMKNSKDCKFLKLKKGDNYHNIYKQEFKSKQILKEKIPSTSNSESNFDQSKCKICYVNEVQMLFLPCQHIMSCVDCSLVLKQCGVCRLDIKEKIRIFLA